ncbi:MAG: aminotransferase class I and II [Solirubrobacterales bacterium]
MAGRLRSTLMTALTAPKTVKATRYVTPLREGGSMPGLMEADDDGLYVVKFRAAGQGTLALAAELIAASIAETLGIRMPPLVFVDVDPALGVAEPDPEIKELIVGSPGVNLGSDFLPGATTYSPADERQPSGEEAAAIVWFDSLITNVDRSPRNPNLLVWHDELWAIDHGAALYRQHAGLEGADPAGAFPQIADHVLLAHAGSIIEAGARLAPLVTRDALTAAVEVVPEQWFTGSPAAAYVDYLAARVDASAEFSEEAERARR